MKCVNGTIRLIRQVSLIKQAILQKTSVERIAKLVADPVYREKASERIFGKFPQNFQFGVTNRGYEVESSYSSSLSNLWDAHDLHAVDGPILGNLLGKCAKFKPNLKSFEANRWNPPKIAADVQARVDSDVQLIKEMGMTSYHFSVSFNKMYNNDDSLNREYLRQ